MAIDKRVQRTQMLLRNALLDLMKKKPIDLITTTELCARAGINRNTFYSHYSSPAILLQSLEDEFIAKVLTIVDETVWKGDYATNLEMTCQAVYDNRELAKVLLSENGNRNYLSRLIGTMHDRVLDLWDNSDTALCREDLDMLYFYVTFGTQKCIQQWMENGFQQSPKEVAGKLTRVTEFVLDHYMAEEQI